MPRFLLFPDQSAYSVDLSISLPLNGSACWLHGEMETQINRPHRAPKEKKKKTPGGEVNHQAPRLLIDKLPERNAKAFVVANPGRLNKQAARSQDVRTMSPSI